MKFGRAGRSAQYWSAMIAHDRTSPCPNAQAELFWSSQSSSPDARGSRRTCPRKAGSETSATGSPTRPARERMPRQCRNRHAVPWRIPARQTEGARKPVTRALQRICALPECGVARRKASVRIERPPSRHWNVPAYVPKKILVVIVGFACTLAGTLASAQVTLYQQERFLWLAMSPRTARMSNLETRRLQQPRVFGHRRTRQLQVCGESGFRGYCIVLRPGQYPSLGAMGLNNRISLVATSRRRSESLLRAGTATRAVSVLPASRRTPLSGGCGCDAPWSVRPQRLLGRATAGRRAAAQPNVPRDHRRCTGRRVGASDRRWHRAGSSRRPSAQSAGVALGANANRGSQTYTQTFSAARALLDRARSHTGT